MSAHHHHHENHDHSRGASGSVIENKLTWALAITVGIFAMELIGGFFSNSLALKSDAGHLLGDVMALGLSLFAVKIAKLPATSKRTFGYHRSEVLAAVINGSTLLFLAIYIFIEAYQRLLHPEPIKSVMMLIIAVLGLAANLLVLFRLHGHASENLNVRAAFLHVVGDMLASVGVVIGGLIMLLTGNYLADPIISFLVGLIILFGAAGVIREALNILLEGAPQNIDYALLKADIEGIDGILSVHDLHIWTLSSANVVLSAHVMVHEQSTHLSQEILRSVKSVLQAKYGIRHATIQIECQCCSQVECGCEVF